MFVNHRIPPIILNRNRIKAVCSIITSTVNIGGFRCNTSLTSKANNDGKNVFRKVNNYNSTSTFRIKLARIAKPFQDLLAQLSATPPSNQLAFGLTATDLVATTPRTQSSSNNTTARILALDMQGEAHLRKYLAHQTMAMFSRHPNDTGSPEVQAALLSLHITALRRHTAAYRHDQVAERKIVEWEDARRKILRYLKRISLERYFTCVDRLGLPHELVEPRSEHFPTPRTIRPKSVAGQRKALARSNAKKRKRRH